uniref:DNA-directed RNA polymerase subunit n=1 Tax=Rhizophora mucronata TaxID=61149 RepID=A0A2P2J5M4_RHIMU
MSGYSYLSNIPHVGQNSIFVLFLSNCVEQVETVTLLLWMAVPEEWYSGEDGSMVICR